MTGNDTGAGPLSRQEVLERLQELLREILTLESAQSIRPEASLADDLQFDSLGMVDLVIGVEETFDLKVQSDLNLFEKVKTVEDAVDLVLELTGTRA